MSGAAALNGAASLRTYYAIDDTGVISTTMRSNLELAEFVADVRAAGSTLEWTANPTVEQLAAWDDRGR